MPTYYPLQTKVQLCTSGLADTTTSTPERAKGKSATFKTEHAENIMKNGRVMKETPIALGQDDARLHFIGPNGDLPFYLMHASEDSPNPSGEETVVERALQKLRLYESRPNKSTVPSFSTISTLTSLDPDEEFSKSEHDNEYAARKSTSRVSTVSSITPSQFALEIEKRRMAPIKGHGLPNHISSVPTAPPDVSNTPANQHSLRHGPGTQDHEPSLIPQALGLSLNFSDQTFVRAFDRKNALQDIKTDVYVNGEFIECTTAPARGAGEFKSKAAEGSMAPLVSGKRVHRMAERALVLVPPHQNANGSMRLRNRSRASLAGPEERWNQVNAAILEEANRLGFDQHGERSPVGAYLASVAALPMPSAVGNFQKAGGPKFGVIDIVISVGTGWKLGPTSPYIMKPTRMENKEFVPKHGRDLGAGDNLLAADASAPVVKKTFVDVKGDDSSSAQDTTALQEENKEEFSFSELEHPDQQALPQALPQALSPLNRPQTPPNDDSGQLEASTLSLFNAHRLNNKLDPPVVFPPFQTPSIESSPESGLPRRDTTRSRRSIGKAEWNGLFGTPFGSPSVMYSSQRSMPPPRTPISSFGSAHKRRRSDTIQFSETQPSAKRNGGPSINNAESAGGPIGITRRGQFTRGRKDLIGSPKGTVTAETNAKLSPAKTSSIRRVIIKNQGEIIVDRRFSTPLRLLHNDFRSGIITMPSSPVYPLPESVVFGTRNLSDAITPLIAPAPIFQPPTPQPSSSPTHKIRKSRSSSPRKASQTPVNQRSHVAKPIGVREQKAREQRAREQVDQMAVLNDAWKTPELSKDCVVSFAEEGPWRTGVNRKGGVWRQIRSARPGYFKESEVLFGVRYLIG